MARPTKYADDTIERAEYYIDNHLEHGDKVPIAAGLAVHLGVSLSTLYKWAGERPEFSDTLDYLQTAQHRMLANGGLGNDFNSAITKLMLANHGYSDRQQVEHKGGVTISVSENLARTAS